MSRWQIFKSEHSLIMVGFFRCNKPHWCGQTERLVEENGKQPLDINYINDYKNIQQKRTSG